MWVKKNVLHLDDDEIKDMQKEIDSEPEPQVPGQGDQMMQQDQQEQITPEQAAPVNNTVERGEEESDTPELDSVVKRFSRVLNNR